MFEIELSICIKMDLVLNKTQPTNQPKNMEKMIMIQMNQILALDIP